MSRYEKINYDELEMLAANGGMDQPPVPYTVWSCNCTKGDFCKGFSKGFRDGLRATVAASKAILTVTGNCWGNIKPKN